MLRFFNQIFKASVQTTNFFSVKLFFKIAHYPRPNEPHQIADIRAISRTASVSTNGKVSFWFNFLQKTFHYGTNIDFQSGVYECVPLCSNFGPRFSLETFSWRDIISMNLNWIERRVEKKKTHIIYLISGEMAKVLLWGKLLKSLEIGFFFRSFDTVQFSNLLPKWGEKNAMQIPIN